MNILSQLSLFEEDDFENLGDLERLQTVLNTLDDEELIRRLYSIRGKGRNDWPCEAMWNSFIASFLFQHESIESLLRELMRNSQLRKLCGFEPKIVKQEDGTTKIYLAPSPSSYSKFLKNLQLCQDELNRMFAKLVGYMYENLDGFGDILMVDGKAIQSFGRKISRNKKSGCRGEHDADWCKKEYSTSGPNGESIIKTKKWFGFRLHLIADATYEIPVAYTVTKASNSEKTETKELLNRIEEEHPEWIESCRFFLGDKGYDSNPILEWLRRKDISPVIDICNHWGNGDKTRQYRNTDLIYDYKGNVWYVDENGKQIELVCKGYDKRTDSIRYGFKPQAHDSRIYRIKCEEDRRIFTPLARNTKKWKRMYKKRTGVERVNGRIDRDYRFERHTIRGLQKMNMFMTVSFLIYMTLAKAKIENGQTEHICKMYA